MLGNETPTVLGGGAVQSSYRRRRVQTDELPTILDPEPDPQMRERQKRRRPESVPTVLTNY